MTTHDTVSLQPGSPMMLRACVVHIVRVLEGTEGGPRVLVCTGSGQFCVPADRLAPPPANLLLFRPRGIHPC